jgi:NAD(P) transhydrogenase subunit alpha
MVKSMRTNSVIVDLASENGGNCALSEHGKTHVKHGVTIHSPGNPTSGIAADASQLFARNVFAFIKGISVIDNGVVSVNWDDEIVKATLLTKDGSVVHPALDAVHKKSVNEELEKTKIKSETKAELKSKVEIKQKAVSKLKTEAKAKADVKPKVLPKTEPENKEKN